MLEKNIPIRKIASNSFPFFYFYIFSKSFKKFIYGEHLLKWANILQNNNKVVCLSARKHGKSTTLYAFCTWKVFFSKEDLEILYLSYKRELAAYHTSNIKKHIENNPLRNDVIDLTHAQSVLRYKNKQGCLITITPEGVLSFKRGRHPDIVICDDILADPANVLNIQVLLKINRLFFEEIMSLPKEGGAIYVWGTAQDNQDIFFELKKNKEFYWEAFPAIKSFTKKQVLWKEMFPYERLMQIKNELKERSFNKEYMCHPVRTEESFFKREDILACVDNRLINIKPSIQKNDLEDYINNI